MYLMQQLEKLFNETTLFANVARPRRFALWTSILPNCVDTTLRGAVSSQNVVTESCTSPATDSKVRLEITACFGLIQKQQTTGSMQQPEPCRRRRQAPYTATSPLHESTGKSKNKWKRLVLFMVEEILFPGSRWNCLFSRELVLCLHHFPHDFVSLS